MSEVVDIRRDAPQDGGRALLAEALLQVAQGNRAAFEDLYRRTSAKLFGICLRILPRSDAEEALQETYLAVWRRAETFDPRHGSPMTWLITIARNRAVDRLRARRPISSAPIELADTVVDEAPDAFTLLDADGEAVRLNHCLGTLGDGDAGFVRTAFFEGSSYSELATRAGIPLGTIKSRIRRALLKLRDCLA